jgi:predicted amidohydrolase
MAFLLGLAQCRHPQDGDVVGMADAWMRRAKDAGVSLLVFPENLMCPHELTARELLDLSEYCNGPFATEICHIARQQRLWIVFTMSETNPDGGRPFNTAAVANPDGALVATYQKCHLYDAHAVRESDRMCAGNALCTPVQTPFCTLGLGICYDLRFPEVARSLALSGCDLVVFPAAWHDGPNKELHWQTLLRSRAIENETFVAGVCHGASRYVRTSYVFDPLGNTLVSGSDGLLVCDINPQSLRSARESMPIFEHRRPELYTSLY